MKNCPKCGTELPDNAKFCPVCGAAQETQPVAQPASEDYEAETSLLKPEMDSPEDSTTLLTGELYEEMQNASKAAGFTDVSVNPYQNQQTAPVQNQYLQTTSVQNQYQQTASVQNQYGQPNYAAPQFQQYGAYGITAVKAPKPKGQGFSMLKKMKSSGISVFALVGLLSAVLLLVSPFMNFISVHAGFKIKEESGRHPVSLELGASDGLNLFELSKGHKVYNNIMDALRQTYSEFGGGVSDDYVVSVLDMINPDVVEKKITLLCKSSGSNLDPGEIVECFNPTESISDFEDYYNEYNDVDYNVDGSSEVDTGFVKEVLGGIRLVLKGGVVLFIAPFILILAGLAAIVFTLMEKRIPQMIAGGLGLVMVVWLGFTTKYFFAASGLGAWIMILASIGLIVAGIFGGKKKAF